MPTPPSPAESSARPMRADARRNRLRILDAAEAVFAEGGTAAPVDEVAARAGVGVGTVYRHFPTKEALMQAILLQRIDELTEEAAAVDVEADPEAFFRLVGRMVSVAAAHRDLAEELARLGGDAGHAAFKAEVRARLHGCLSALLRSAQAAGAVRADVTVDDVLALVGATCFAAGAGAAVPERVVAVVCDGLRARPR